LIFVTVGSADPFDRMIRAIDEWAGSRGRTDIFAQIGKSSYKPVNIEAVQFLSPAQFRERICSARLIVAHAGMGSIIAALEVGTPIIVMPKWAHLGEHRNDHQVATARHFGSKAGITVAQDENDLKVKLDQENALQAPERIPTVASPELIAELKSFISNGKATAKASGPSLWSLRERLW
jgi:UDP-N-acetylglucosamine transferase subunit ALG13